MWFWQDVNIFLRRAKWEENNAQKIATELNRKGKELQKKYSYKFKDFLFIKYHNFGNDQLIQLMQGSAALSKVPRHSSPSSLQKSNL